MGDLNMYETPEEYEKSAGRKRARIMELEAEVSRKKSLGQSAYSEVDEIKDLETQAEREEEKARTMRYGPVTNRSYVAEQAERDAAELWGRRAEPPRSKYMRDFEV